VTGARTQEWKYIRYASAREDELYHLPTDPGERRNLIDQHPAQAAELRRLLEEFAGQVARG
jgi:arylsulfatase A-like enzyme